MGYFKRRRHRRKPYPDEPPELPETDDPADLGSTGSEAKYLRSLIDSRKTVSVVFTTGGKLRGKIRYFDQDCFSLGPVGRGPNVLLRKGCVRYIVEE